MILTSGTHMYLCTRYSTTCTNFKFVDFNSLESVREQTLPCCKVGQALYLISDIGMVCFYHSHIRICGSAHT